MHDIGAWLDGLGLGRYAEAFAAADVDAEVLRDLGEGDLEKLDVSLGHRKKLLKAIAALDSAEADVRAPAREAERRQISVMFCDLVGSTALAERLDPEELRSLMRAYGKACGEVIGRYEGHFAQYLGDGVMAYFGWPRAHEDDAQRAARAGLDIVETVGRLDGGPAVRIGIATGLVVVGETGEDAADAKLAVGETPNLAARVQALAEPNSVAVAPSTRRLLGGVFELSDLGGHALRGVSEPVQVHRVLREASAESRFEATRGAGLTPLVGRETEVSLLLERWDQAKAGEGQVVLLAGEPGIGKSRITQVLRERVAAEPHTRLRYQCSPYYANTAFYPVIVQLERAAGFERDDAADARLDKLESLLAQSADELAAVAPLFAAMLSLPLDRYSPLAVSPQKQKELTIAALADQLAALAARTPVLMIFEDAHWADPTTVEMLAAMIGRVEAAAALLVVTYRPEFAPPWAGHGHVTTLTLNRLSRRQGADMVAKVTGGKALPDEVLDQIVAKTDGVPLFVEELTKTVLEAGFLDEQADRYVLSGPLPPLAIPATLQDSLMARLDRLSPVKEVAQIGACIGRDFSYELLAAVSPLRDNELRDALQQLVNSELIFRRGAPPTATYSFKHGLVQDAAYESLLKSRRQQVHVSIARTLEHRFSVVLETEPEVAALHYGLAGRRLEAAAYWLKAGVRSLKTWTLLEAESHLRRGLAEVDGLPDTSRRHKIELDLRASLGTCLMASVGWAHESVSQALRPAVVLAEKLCEDQALAAVVWGIWLNLACQGKLVASLAVLEEWDLASEGKSGSDLALVRDEAASCTHFWMGEFEKGREASEQILTHYSYNRHSHIADFTIHDPKAIALHWSGSFQLWIRGFPNQCKGQMKEQLNYAKALENPFNLSFSLTSGGFPLAFFGRSDELLTRCNEAEAIARDQRMAIIEHCIVPWVKSAALIEKGEYAEGYKLGSAAQEVWSNISGKLNRPLSCAHNGLALAHTGNIREAVKLVDEAIESGRANHEHWAYAEAHRLRGEICLLGDSPNEREAESFRSAGAGLWLVHRGVRHRRPEGGEGAARRTRVRPS